MARKRIGKRDIDNLPPNTDIWDAVVSGFGARRRSGPGVSYVVMRRTKAGKLLRITIGKHGAPWTPDTARDEALRLLNEIVDGGDPAADKRAKREALTVGELLDDYMAAAESGKLLTRARRPKKPSTIATDRSRVEAHIRPLLGSRRVEDVTPRDIEEFMEGIIAGETAKRAKGERKHSLHNVRGGQGAASRTMGLLGAIFAYAVKRRIRADNPVRGVVRHADGKRERRLSHEEYKALGDGLRKATEDGMWPASVALARFLTLTGWRLGEGLKLRWVEVDMASRTAILADSKTGKSTRPLSHAACAVLASLGRTGDLVFPSGKTGRVMAGFRSSWDRLMALAGLPDDITPHVLRHSLASTAAEIGYSELSIAALIGHKSGSITSRYVHHADATILAAADAVSHEIARQMGDTKLPGTVVELRRA